MYVGNFFIKKTLKYLFFNPNRENDLGEGERRCV